ASAMPAAELARRGVVTVAHRNGGFTEREIPARDFFVDLLTTSLQPGEIITGVRLPMAQGRAGGAYVKIRNKASHYALAGAAVMLQMGDHGTCKHASIPLTGVGSKHVRRERAENALRCHKLAESGIPEAANAAKGHVR